MKLQAIHPGDSLRYGRPDWVRSLSHAVRIAAWGLLLGAAACVAIAATPPGAAEVVCQAASAAGGACLLGGTWRLSRRDPNGSTPPTDAAVRWTLRVLLAVGAAGTLLPLVRVAGSSTPNFIPPAVAIAGAADVSGRLMFLVFLRRLALRVPDGALARRLRSLLLPYALAAITAATTGAYTTVPLDTRPGVAASLASALATLAVVYHLRRLRRCIDIQADYAQGIWSSTHAARPPAPPFAA